MKTPSGNKNSTAPAVQHDTWTGRLRSRPAPTPARPTAPTAARTTNLPRNTPLPHAHNSRIAKLPKKRDAEIRRRMNLKSAAEGYTGLLAGERTVQFGKEVIEEAGSSLHISRFESDGEEEAGPETPVGQQRFVVDPESPLDTPEQPVRGGLIRAYQRDPRVVAYEKRMQEESEDKDGDGEMSENEEEEAQEEDEGEEEGMVEEEVEYYKSIWGWLDEVED